MQKTGFRDGFAVLFCIASLGAPSSVRAGHASKIFCMGGIEKAAATGRVNPSVVPSANLLAVRGAGTLLAVSSLPGEYGVGDFGSGEAFINWLAEAKQKWWQVLPLNPADSSNSPFSSESSLAIDSAYLDIEQLIEFELVTPSEAASWKLENTGKSHFEHARRVRKEALDLAFDRFSKGRFANLKAAFKKFQTRNGYWLTNHSSYTVIKNQHGYDFTTWPSTLRDATWPSLPIFQRVRSKEIARIEFEQFLLDFQWKGLKSHAASKGISIIGDMPLYMARYSADVWGEPKAFQLDRFKRPTKVSGYPPCDFYKLGQLWGTPLYDWENLRRMDYAFWVRRVKRMLALYDVVRIDHFLGLDQYYAIDAKAENAVNGEWLKADGNALLARLVQEFGKNVPLIAEDLGAAVPKSVIQLRDQYSIPGMFILQFGHGGDSPDKYHNTGKYSQRGVAYTGNHDMPTLKEWIASATKLDTLSEWVWIARLLGSQANLAIVPAQDILGLGADARMNIPGTWSMAPVPERRRDNWVWRVEEGQLTSEVAKTFAAIVEATKR